jgi:hypothetical protein
MANCYLDYVNFQRMLEKGCLGMGKEDPTLIELVHSAAAALAGKPMDLRSCVLFMLHSLNQDFPEKAEFSRRLVAFMQEEKE